MISNKEQVSHNPSFKHIILSIVGLSLLLSSCTARKNNYNISAPDRSTLTHKLENIPGFTQGPIVDFLKEQIGIDNTREILAQQLVEDTTTQRLDYYSEQTDWHLAAYAPEDYIFPSETELENIDNYINDTYCGGILDQCGYPTESVMVVNNFGGEESEAHLSTITYASENTTSSIVNLSDVADDYPTDGFIVEYTNAILGKGLIEISIQEQICNGIGHAYFYAQSGMPTSEYLSLPEVEWRRSDDEIVTLKPYEDYDNFCNQVLGLHCSK